MQHTSGLFHISSFSLLTPSLVWGFFIHLFIHSFKHLFTQNEFESYSVQDTIITQGLALEHVWLG
jgi:hypothetical protein